MYLHRLLACSTLAYLICIGATGSPYLPTWDSLDQRPLPAWYDDAKLGVMITMGVFSVPGFRSEWFWHQWKVGHSKDIEDFMKKNYPPGFSYQDFAPLYRLRFFDPDKWTDIFEAAGAKYIVLIAKHHDGFTNWPSDTSWNWNSVDTGPHRDIVGELANATRRRSDIRFGLYHSLYEWFNPKYLEDQESGYKQQNFVKTKTMPELYDLVNTYKPEVIFSDGAWDVTSNYWNSTHFLAWLYNDSPVKDTVVVNDRWGKETECRHGDYFNCKDRFSPGKLQKHKWENVMTIGRHWGYLRNAQLGDFITIDKLVALLAETVSCGGNLLVNVAPTDDGIIPPIYEERLRQLGAWLKINGEAIYGSKPWDFQNDTVTSGIWYTSRKSGDGITVYATSLKWPVDKTLTLGVVQPNPNMEVSLLGHEGALRWAKSDPSGIVIYLPDLPETHMPCKWAWTFKLKTTKYEKSEL